MASPARWNDEIRNCPVLIAIRSRCRRRLRNRTRLTGSTTFTGNSAFEDGAAIYNSRREEDPVVTTTTYPSDTVFEGNNADVRRFPLYTFECTVLLSHRKSSLLMTAVYMTTVTYAKLRQ